MISLFCISEDGGEGGFHGVIVELEDEREGVGIDDAPTSAMMNEAGATTTATSAPAPPGRWRSQRQRQQDEQRRRDEGGHGGGQVRDGQVRGGAAGRGWRDEGGEGRGAQRDAEDRARRGNRHEGGRAQQQKDWGGPPRDGGASCQRVATMAGDRVRGAWVFNAEGGAYAGEDGYEEVEHSAGMVWSRRQPGPAPACVYYQDVRRMYKFQCGDAGLRLLSGLVRAKHRVLESNRSRIESDPGGADRLRREGERMYVNKANLEKQGVTWSHEEYAHLGLQKVYLQTKCYQRFTETYNLMDRMRPVLLQVLRDAWRDGGPVRVASIGGGPGFELHAVREWVRSASAGLGVPAADADARMDLVSLDLQGDWAPYASELGLRFVGDWDLRRGDLVARCGGGPVHLAIISYVLIYTGEDSTADMLAGLLRAPDAGGGGLRALMISERAHRQPMAAKMQAREVDLVRLMPQDRGADDRQLLVLPRGHRRLYGFSGPEREVTFENVPYARGT